MRSLVNALYMAALYLVPVLTFAQQPNLRLLVRKVSFYILNPLISIMFGAALIVFLWGVAQYFWEKDSEEARTKGSRHIMWGLIGMAIMFAGYAIVSLIVSSIGATVKINEF